MKGVRDSDVEIYRRKHYTAQFGIDTWYDGPLKEHTFKTEMLPIEFDEAQAIVDTFHKKNITQEQKNLLNNVNNFILNFP